MTTSTHPGSLQFQPFDSQYPLIATALAGGIASVAVAFAHTPTIKYFEPGVKAQSNFASPAAEDSNSVGWKHVPNANLAQTINLKPEASGSARNRLPTMESDASPIARIDSQRRLVQPGVRPDSPNSGRKNLAIEFDLPPVTGPVGAFGNAKPIATADHAVIAFTLPDLPREHEPALTPGTAEPAVQPIAVADGLNPLFGASESVTPIGSLEISSGNANLANASYGAEGAMPDHPGQASRIASPEAEDAQQPLINTSDAVAKFDLAKVPRAATTAPGRLSNRTSGLTETAAQHPRGKALRLAGAAPSHDRIINGAIMHDTSVSVNNHIAGRLAVRIDAKGGLAIRLGDLLAMVQTEMAPSTYSRLAGATATDEYLSFATLRNAGIDLRYDAGNDLLVISEQS